MPFSHFSYKHSHNVLHTTYQDDHLDQSLITASTKWIIYHVGYSKTIHHETCNDMLALIFHKSICGPKIDDNKLHMQRPKYSELNNNHQNHLKKSGPHVTPSSIIICLFFLHYRIPDLETCTRINTGGWYYKVSCVKSWINYLNHCNQIYITNNKIYAMISYFAGHWVPPSRLMLDEWQN